MVNTNPHLTVPLMKSFSEEDKKELVKCLQTASKMHYGLSRHDLLHLAHNYAIANRMKIRDSWQKNQAAGKQCYYDFVRHHNKLSLRKPEATSPTHATGFSRSMSLFFLIFLGF
jgi:hypothetical protein